VTLRLSQSQVSLIILGWAFAQFPYLVEPDITIYSAAAPRTTLQFLIAALAAGVLVLFPAYYYLFRIFKGEASTASPSARRKLS
jgi:cytochrome d ubiquinol oxidase subunit II